MDQYKVIGIMSGTSLDGVDIAYCEFSKEPGWSYRIIHAETIPYEQNWLTRLKELHKQPAFLYPKTDAYYGKYLGMLVNDFISRYHIKPDLISSHGHTIFHQPENGFTAQIGSGAAIHAETGLKVVNNFRAVDVALNGQGAPLVPVGDELLFSDHASCLNLGGFSNISFRQHGKRIAFDISPCNIIMNPLANAAGLPYDDEGKIASAGSIHAELLHELDALPFYKNIKAKSLGNEWVQQQFWPLVKKYEMSTGDLMSTFSEHIAGQIASVLNRHHIPTVLVTGGGALNTELITRIGKKSESVLTIPAPELIHFKEALIFAFLGVLRLRNEHNCLSEVTGASRNSMGGSIWG